MASHRTFEDTYQSHLKKAQRREVLDTLREALQRSTTIGEVIDAAESIGWGEAMGDLRLADLAAALAARGEDDDGQTLRERLASSPVALVAEGDDEAMDAAESEDVGEDEPKASKKRTSKKKTASKKKAAAKKTTSKKKASAKKTASQKKAAAKKATSKKTTSKKKAASKKKTAKKAAKKKTARKK